MSSIWTLPFDLFTGQPADIATRLREYDLKARSYQAMGRYWTGIFRLLKARKSQTEQQSEAITITEDFYNDLRKVFTKFKRGEDYNALNPLEKVGDRITKQLHKMFLGSEMVGDKALQDIQERLETLWDDLWELKAEDRSAFDALLTKFAYDTWAAMGLPASNAPQFGPNAFPANGGKAEGAIPT